jgi:hypothetical protein
LREERPEIPFTVKNENETAKIWTDALNFKSGIIEVPKEFSCD